MVKVGKAKEEEEKEGNDMSGTFEIAGKTCNCVCVCVSVCVRGSLLYFIEIDILGSKCIGAEHITFIICCSCLAVSFSSAFFFCSLQSPLPLAPRGILHSQLIRIFVGSKVKSSDITKWVSLVSL